MPYRKIIESSFLFFLFWIFSLKGNCFPHLSVIIISLKLITRLKLESLKAHYFKFNGERSFSLTNMVHIQSFMTNHKNKKKMQCIIYKCKNNFIQLSILVYEINQNEKNFWKNLKELFSRKESKISPNDNNAIIKPKSLQFKVRLTKKSFKVSLIIHRFCDFFFGKLKALNVAV